MKRQIVKSTHALFSASRISLLCLSFLYVSSNNAQVNPQPGQNLWHLTAAIGTAIDQLSFSATDLSGTFTALAHATLCNPIPLSQSDVVAGSITLNIPGSSYCLAQTMTANIVIQAANVVLDLNDHVLIGVVSVNANEAIIRNGTISAPAPVDSTDVLTPAITIASGVQKTQLINAILQCQDTTLGDVNGRGVLANSGIDTYVKECLITSGKGGIPVSTVTVSGNCVQILNGSIVIENCTIKAADGSDDVTQTMQGGFGGAGVQYASAPISGTIKECIISGGKGGDGAFGSGGSPGVGNPFLGNGMIIDSCTLTGGNGGNSIALNDGGNGSLAMQAGNGIITNCILKGGNGGTSQDATGGPGGSGCDLASANIVMDCTIFGGNGGDSTTGTGGTAGAGIFVVGSPNNTIMNCLIQSGMGGGTGGGTAGNGADGIKIFGGSNNTEIRNCTLQFCGQAGSGGGVPTLGLAINDQTVPDAAAPATFTSKIFGNFAHDIANITQYIIKNQNSGALSNGISVYAAPVSPLYDNVFVP